MEAIGVTASVLGIATFALQIVKLLNDDIESIRNAPETLRKVSIDLNALSPVLRTLEDAAKSTDPVVQQRLKAILPAVENCAGACNEFHTQLADWTKHSSSNNASRMSTSKFALFGKTRMQTLRAQISSCKETLTVVLVATHFIDPSYGVTNEILLQKFTDTMTDMQRQLSTIEQMSPDPENEEARKALLAEMQRHLLINTATKDDIARMISLG